MSKSTISNDEVAKVLEEIPEYQDANEYRVAVYRKAADSIQTVDESVAENMNAENFMKKKAWVNLLKNEK